MVSETWRMFEKERAVRKEWVRAQRGGGLKMREKRKKDNSLGSFKIKLKSSPIQPY